MWGEACSQKGDNICIQETHLPKLNPPQVSHKAFPHIFYTNAEKKQKRVLIAIQDMVSFSQLFLECDHTFTIGKLYAPNTQHSSEAFPGGCPAQGEETIAGSSYTLQRF